MIKIKNGLIVAILAMSAGSVLGDDKPGQGAGGCPCTEDLTNIKMAVHGAVKDTSVNGIITPGADSVVSALNKIFILGGEGPQQAGKDRQSILDTKIDLYVKNFYTWYGKKAFAIQNNAPSQSPAAAANQGLFAEYGQDKLQQDYQDLNTAVREEVEKYINMGLGKAEPPKDKPNSTQEGDVSGRSSEKTKKDDQKKPNNNAKIQLIKQVNDYVSGSDDGAKKVSYPAMLNPLNIFAKGDAGQADNFIESLKNSLPIMQNYVFPSEKQALAIAKAKQTIEITVPPYIDDGKEKTTKSFSRPDPSDANEVYVQSYMESVKGRVESNATYQKYLLKRLSDLAIKSGYISNIAYMFKKQEVKQGSTGPSLAEKEKNMALEGLNTAYYYGTTQDPLTIADISLKTLHTNNKIVYFLYQILRQMEYANYIQSLKSLQEQQISAITDQQDIDTINKLIDDLVAKIKAEKKSKV